MGKAAPPESPSYMPVLRLGHHRPTLRITNAVITSRLVVPQCPRRPSRSNHRHRIELRPVASPAPQPGDPDPTTETEGSPLDFPEEWTKPPPSRRPDIFPEFKPIKTPMPKPMPGDPEEQDEEDEEDKEKDPDEPE